MLEQIKVAFAVSKEKGGVSFNASQVNPKEGYFVAFRDREMTLNIHEYTEQALIDYVAENEPILASISNSFVGVWFDTDKNVYVLDVSEQITDKERAIRNGIARNQKAIYDAKKDEVIFLPTPQTSGTYMQQQTYLNMKVRELLF